jgi:hypothetical protein
VLLSVAIRDVGVEEARGRLVAVFTLSAVPDPTWVGFFRKRARYSVFNASAAAFLHDQARIELPCREDLDTLARSVERFVEGANLDMELSDGQ